MKNLQNHKTQKKRLLKGRQKVLNSFESKTFLIVKQTQGKVQLLNLVKWLKTLTPKHMLQGLPIALAQVKAGKSISKLTKWNLSNNTFFVSSKISYLKYITI